MSTRPARIDQVVPSLGAGDAIGTHVVLLRDLLRDLGFRSDIWCQGSFPETRHLARYVADLDDAFRPDTWWLYHLSSGSPVAERIAARPEPKILDYHNITPAALFGSWVPWATEEAEVGYRQLGLLGAAAFFAVSDSEFNEGDVLAAGVPASSSAVAPPLFDLDRASRASSGAAVAGDRDGMDAATLARRTAERAGGGTDWLFVGRITPSKAQHDVVKAFACYREVFDPEARLHLVGTQMGDDYRRALERYAARLGLGRAVRFCGAVPDDVLAAYWATVDVFVCASEHEGFCIPVVEAMHHGVPVVAYAAGAIPETAGDGALLLDTKAPLALATAADRVVRDAAVRARLVGAGRTRAGTFSLRASRRRWAAVIDEAVKAAEAADVAGAGTAR